MTCEPTDITDEHTQFLQRFASTELDLEARAAKRILRRRGGSRTRARRWGGEWRRRARHRRRSGGARHRWPPRRRPRAPPLRPRRRLWVQGAEIPALDPGGDEDLAIAIPALPSTSTKELGIYRVFVHKPLESMLFHGMERYPRKKVSRFLFEPDSSLFPFFSIRLTGLISTSSQYPDGETICSPIQMMEQMVFKWSGGSNEEGVTLKKPRTNTKIEGPKQSRPLISFIHGWGFPFCLSCPMAPNWFNDMFTRTLANQKAAMLSLYLSLSLSLSEKPWCK